MMTSMMTRAEKIEAKLKEIEGEKTNEGAEHQKYIISNFVARRFAQFFAILSFVALTNSPSIMGLYLGFYSHHLFDAPKEQYVYYSSKSLRNETIETTSLQHTGNCMASAMTLNCSCFADYVSLTCELFKPCGSSPCQHQATCLRVRQTEAMMCDCALGFSGFFCEQNIDDCKGVTCENGGRCEDLVGNFTCNCSVGFTGRHCEYEVDECASNPCVNGHCMDHVGSFSCFCNPGFRDTICNSTKTCLHSKNQVYMVSQVDVRARRRDLHLRITVSPSNLYVLLQTEAGHYEIVRYKQRDNFYFFENRTSLGVVFDVRITPSLQYSSFWDKIYVQGLHSILSFDLDLSNKTSLEGDMKANTDFYPEENGFVALTTYGNTIVLSTPGYLILYNYTAWWRIRLDEYFASNHTAVTDPLLMRSCTGLNPSLMIYNTIKNVMLGVFDTLEKQTEREIRDLLEGSKMSQQGFIGCDFCSGEGYIAKCDINVTILFKRGAFDDVKPFKTNLTVGDDHQHSDLVHTVMTDEYLYTLLADGFVFVVRVGPECAAENRLQCGANGQCFDLEGVPSCVCRKGYFGPHCATKASPCLLATCNADGLHRCVPYLDHYYCQCKPGWSGYECQNEDLCTNSTCQNGGVCFTRQAKIECHCNEPYFGRNCEEKMIEIRHRIAGKHYFIATNRHRKLAEDLLGIAHLGDYIYALFPKKLYITLRPPNPSTIVVHLYHKTKGYFGGNMASYPDEELLLVVKKDWLSKASLELRDRNGLLLKTIYYFDKKRYSDILVCVQGKDVLLWVNDHKWLQSITHTYLLYGTIFKSFFIITKAMKLPDHVYKAFPPILTRIQVFPYTICTLNPMSFIAMENSVTDITSKLYYITETTKTVQTYYHLLLCIACANEHLSFALFRHHDFGVYKKHYIKLLGHYAQEDQSSVVRLITEAGQIIKVMHYLNSKLFISFYNPTHESQRKRLTKVMVLDFFNDERHCKQISVNHRTKFGGSCGKCESGFTGRYCETRIIGPCRYCDSQGTVACDTSGHNKIGLFDKFRENTIHKKREDRRTSKCICKKGYRGKTCADSNVCVSKPCGKQGYCLTRRKIDFKNYKCFCPATGFYNTRCKERATDLSDLVLDVKQPIGRRTPATNSMKRGNNYAFLSRRIFVGISFNLVAIFYLDGTVDERRESCQLSKRRTRTNNFMIYFAPLRRILYFSRTNTMYFFRPNNCRSKKWKRIKLLVNPSKKRTAKKTYNVKWDKGGKKATMFYRMGNGTANKQETRRKTGVKITGVTEYDKHLFVSARTTYSDKTKSNIILKINASFHYHEMDVISKYVLTEVVVSTGKCMACVGQNATHKRLLLSVADAFMARNATVIYQIPPDATIAKVICDGKGNYLVMERQECHQGFCHTLIFASNKNPNKPITRALTYFDGSFSVAEKAANIHLQQGEMIYDMILISEYRLVVITKDYLITYYLIPYKE